MMCVMMIIVGIFKRTWLYVHVLGCDLVCGCIVACIVSGCCVGVVGVCVGWFVVFVWCD